MYLHNGQQESTASMGIGKLYCRGIADVSVMFVVIRVSQEIDPVCLSNTLRHKHIRTADRLNAMGEMRSEALYIIE